MRFHLTIVNYERTIKPNPTQHFQTAFDAESSREEIPDIITAQVYVESFCQLLYGAHLIKNADARIETEWKDDHLCNVVFKSKTALILLAVAILKPLEAHIKENQAKTDTSDKETLANGSDLPPV